MRLSSIVVGLVALSAAGGFAVGRATSPQPQGPAVEPGAPGIAVARWNGGALTAEQLRERVLAQKTAAGLPALDEASGRTFADAAIRAAVLATEARRLGLERDSKVAGETTDALSARLVELQFDASDKHPAPDQAELEAYYQAHLADFERPDRVRLSMLRVPVARGDAAGVKKKRQELERFRKELSAMTPLAAAAAFAQRVENLRLDAGTAGPAGELGSLSRPQLEGVVGGPLAQAAWLLVGLGQLSEVLEGDDGLYLFRLVGREGALDLPLEKARPQIESRLWYGRRDVELNKFVAGLGNKLGLVVDEAELKKTLAELR